jgi:hypothetical protein
MRLRIAARRWAISMSEKPARIRSRAKVRRLSVDIRALLNRDLSSAMRWQRLDVRIKGLDACNQEIERADDPGALTRERVDDGSEFSHGYTC